MYVFSKAIGYLLEPGDVLVLLLATAVVMQWTRWPRWGLYLASTAAVLFCILLVLPIGTWLVTALEDEYVRPAMPARVDGILVLGGALNPAIFLTRHAPSED